MTADHEEPEGGDAACWLDRACPGCGHLEDGAPPAVCPRCGHATDDRAAPLSGLEPSNRQAPHGDDTAG